MAMWRIRQFEAEDADLLCPVAVSSEFHNNPALWKKWAQACIKFGPAYTALHDGKVIAAAGIRILKDKDGDDVGWVWTVFHPGIKKCKKSAFRSMITLLWILVEKFELKRLVTDSRKGFEASQRLLEHLGFTRLKTETDTHYYYSLERADAL